MTGTGVARRGPAGPATTTAVTAATTAAAGVQPAGSIRTTERPKGWRGFTARIEAATPDNRDRAIDGLRALATLGVVLGHWLVGALVLQPDGALRIASPLQSLGALAPVSWVLQMLGLFFLVGGHASALSWSRARQRGQSYSDWLRRRYGRLLRPVVGAVALSAVCLTVLGAAGVPHDTLRTWVVLLLQPFWFVLVYAVLTALTTYAVAANRRLGGWAALPLLAVVALGDLLRYGPWQDSMPGWIGMVNLVPGWLFAYQLGVSWSSGRLGRRGGWLLLAGGAAGFALLILEFHYPASMVGVPGAGRTNAHPPSLLVPALAAAQSGLAILLRTRINRVLAKPGLWASVALLNLSAMTIFCWHQVPMLLVSMAGAVNGDVAGLTTDPSGVGWVLARLCWLPLMALVLAGIVALTRRFEAPWHTMPRATRMATAACAVGFAGIAIALY